MFKAQTHLPTHKVLSAIKHLDFKLNIKVIDID